MKDRLDGEHHLRATPRYKLFQPGEISVGGATKRVHVLNLSAGGALIYAPEPPARGTPLRVRCGDQSLSARVAWRDDQRFGVAFVVPLTDARVAEIIAAQDALVSAASRRLAAQPA